ncbi:oligosaccharide flippase family protein [Aeribacillus sp. FSL K6-2848]|uniref:oligosaccharide flippase family protein n=1 Tax=Aeribacillus sp. FSL K6-2848 TaxID=2954612 RepID=UPI0030F9EEA9
MFFRNIIWSFFNTIGIQGISIVTTVILARLLTPEIFGFLGIATSVSALILVFQEIGFGSYLIYTKNLKREDISTVFFLNIVISFILSCTMYLLSGIIADFYRIKEVETIIKYISAGMFIGAIGTTSRSILVRNKKFKTLTVIDLVAESLSSIFSVILAFNNMYLISVTSRFLFRPLIRTILLLVMNQKGLFGIPKLRKIKDMFLYSGRVMFSQIMNFLGNNLDYFLIGKMLGAKSLGYYTVAYQWSVIARFAISGAIAKVAFPEISYYQKDFDKVKLIYLNMVNKLAFFTFPICLGLLGIAPEFIEVLYGESWRDSVVILQILLIAGLITSVGTVGGSVLMGIGKADVELKVSIYSTILLGVMIFFGTFYGLLGVAISIVAQTIIIDSYKILQISRCIDLKITSILKCLLPSLISSISMLVSLLSLKLFIVNLNNSFLKMFIMILFGFLFYIIFSYIFNRKVLKWSIYKMKTVLVKNKVYA